MYCEDPRDVKARLLAMIGEPHEQPDGCIKFVRRALWEFGVEIEGTKSGSMRDGRKFRRVQGGSLGTVVVFEGAFNTYLFHVGLMLDHRFAIQSSMATNGVARIEITRYPWDSAIRGFYRPKILD